MFYLTMHSTHFIYGYMASDIWLRTILIVRKETRCCHMGYSYRLTARVLLYAPSHRQDSTHHGLCYTSRGALAGTRNSSMGPPHEGSIRRPIAPWANALPRSYVPLCYMYECLPIFAVVTLSYLRYGQRVIGSVKHVKNTSLFSQGYTQTSTTGMKKVRELLLVFFGTHHYLFILTKYIAHFNKINENYHFHNHIHHNNMA